MDFRLIMTNGKVKYFMRQKGGLVGSDTSLDSAEWMIKNGNLRRSEDYPGYPIAVKTKNDDEYFFAGEWEEEEKRSFFDVEQTGENSEGMKLGKRRMKDIVLE